MKALNYFLSYVYLCLGDMQQFLSSKDVNIFHMLKSIYVKNFILFEELELVLDKGLTVFTGETGAGKSLLVEAFSLLCGKQASSECIRIGENEAVIEGELKLDLNKLDEELKSFLDSDRAIITRKISKDRSSSVRLNGQSITLKQLKRLMKDYVSIVGQHDYMNLCDERFQLSLIDSQESNILNELEVYKTLYKNYLDLKRQLKSSQVQQNELSKDLDLAKFQYEELYTHDFKPEEDIKLDASKRNLKEVGKGKKIFSSLSRKLDELATISQDISSSLAKLTEDELSLELHSFIQNVSLNSSDYSNDCRVRSQEFELLSTIDVNELESRLDLIFKFKKKYSVNSTEQLNDIKENLKQKLSHIDQTNSDFPKLESEFLAFKKKLKKQAKLLDTLRSGPIQNFQELVNNALKKLNISFPQFTVDLKYNEEDFSDLGSNSIQFNISTNPGQPSDTLKKVASGGELSRILLAIQSQSPNLSVIPTLLYDEIDTGVGGLTGNSLGDYLAKISERHQIIVVTHLPQIAQFSNNHFFINKKSKQDNTEITVSKLDNPDHKKELERMLGGESVLRAVKV
ncbi:hypothetical protein DID80_04780 [Candidatus Marinamargulisbacteria bacterium SCGC AAA071-K20]|nr:hypothetical protein DID80_04780 [Candidatus Marinamargulisbacteria bacterium SCGC AAA071-K20]